MKQATKKWIAYLLTLIMLLSVATPVFGAEPGTEESVPETVQTQEVVQSTEKSTNEISQEQVSDEQSPEAQSTNEQDIEKQNSKTSDLEGTNSEEMDSEEINSRDAVSEVAFNYVVTQDDGINQSVIMSFGDETTVIESAVLTYRDGGEVKTAESDTVAENFAVFLLPIAQDGVERVWESAVVRITGIEYTVSLQDSEGMTQTEVSEETASEVLQDTEESLDEETANLVEDSVISTKGDGITGEEIADSIEKSIELVPDADVAAQISTFSMESVGRAVQKYVIVLDPGHGGTDSGAENQNGISSESESKLTLKIANYVKQELEKSSQFVVYMTRTHDSYVGLSERVNYAASKNADILVSLHLNSADSKTANGAEILVPRTGRYNSKVAENAGQLAQDILKKLVSLGLYNRGLVYRDSASGTKYPDGSTADYYAIVRQGLQAGIPSIIVEHAFISSTVDAKFLDSEADLQKIGRADAEGIAQYFGVTLSNSSNNNSNSNSGDSDKNGWVKENRNWYYYKSNAKQTGWQKIWGKYYHFDSDGVMQTGWQKIDGAWYYFGNEKNGAMQVGWQIVDHEYYYIVDSGVMQTYWRKIDGNYYFFGANGVRRTGWQKIWGKWYYLDENGVMQTGWQKIKGVWYYFGGASDGAMKTGWQTINGKTYYFDSEGAMATGTVTIGGTKYEFNSSGALKEETKNEGLYQITGTSSVTVSQMVKYYNTYSSIAYPSAALTKGGAADIETFCKIIKEEADAENMKADVVFIQAMLETGYLKFGGNVKISQFNFAGLGATGNGVAGNSFKDVRTGIRAQVQHLKAYANKEALKNTCVDVRFSYVTRGSAPYVEWLGIQENPNGGGWAASKNYGNDLLGLINKLKAI